MANGPFIRFLGMQEPASVLFSILNGLAHWVGLRRFARNARHSQYPYYTLLRLSGLLAVNSWIWSMVYHTRDFPWTERMDYFSAMASILFSLHVAIVRVFGLRSSRGCTRLFLMSAGYIYFLFHVMYLTLYDFDYGYNMLASIVVGAAHTLLWMAWAAANWRMRSAYAWKITVVGAAITCAMSLELLDFPPIWGVFDAHSLWHAATIPIIPHLWDFFLCDALYITPVKIPGI
ncbi:hypothetical protein BASA60_008469 [Batrachochytrium salamandrivorans]|nr:hypothetical protein BASA60_008469 [Batrachochytrium salamandrivorans]